LSAFSFARRQPGLHLHHLALPLPCRLQHVGRQPVGQPERLHRRRRRAPDDRELRGGQHVAGEHHLLGAVVRAQPHRGAGQRDHLVLPSVEVHPVPRPQHRGPSRPHRAAAAGLTSVSGCSGTDRSAASVRPQQVEQHRQHRDRVARRLGAGHQRRRRREHPPQPLDGLRQVMPGMPVAGQPAHVLGLDRVRSAEQPVLPADQRAALDVASNFATSRGLRRSSGRLSMTTAEPSARRAKKSGACDMRSPASSVQCSQNGWDAMPTTAGSKSSNIKLSRSSQDSNPTWPPVDEDHQSPLR
jgi:hypothetical protein